MQNGRINSPKLRPCLSSRVMSTIITHAIYFQLDICAQIFPHHMMLAKRENKMEQKENFDSLNKSKYIKVKDRPFAEGSRGCHALLWLDAPNINAKECHFILPLLDGPLLCSPSLLLLPQQDRTKLIFSALISHTYLESSFYCLHR